MTDICQTAMVIAPEPGTGRMKLWHLSAELNGRLPCLRLRACFSPSERHIQPGCPLFVRRNKDRTGFWRAQAVIAGDRPMVELKLAET
ncbi:MAG TPA: hypothetical protein VLF21_00370 [Candidatus Saccharimonadales bacterium]|nr:hypothetical protein [Candidatus Saccharimonadales bacterium]